MNKALKDFEYNLNKLRAVAPIKTISMHGRPLKSQDNRDLWREKESQSPLKHVRVLGEVYLDIDYKDIAYINDTEELVVK